MLILTRADLQSLLAPADVIDAVEGAFRAYARGEYRTLPRALLQGKGEGMLLLMASYLGQADALGTKIVTVYRENSRRGLPTIMASYLLHDPGTGEPLALMEAAFITGLRTGATSAVAAIRLARPDSRVLGCFGAGVQAGFQVRCLREVLPIERLLIYSRTRDRADAFAVQLAAELGLEARAVGEPWEAVAEADVVTTATTSKTPVFDGMGLRPGAHVDAVGAFTPETREVDVEAVRRAHVCVDTYEGCWQEAGDILIPIQEGVITREHVRADLGELVSGAKPGRTAPDQITLFKSVGFALEDAATARLAYDRARTRGIGTEIHLS